MFFATFFDSKTSGVGRAEESERPEGLTEGALPRADNHNWRKLFSLYSARSCYAPAEGEWAKSRRGGEAGRPRTTRQNAKDAKVGEGRPEVSALLRRRICSEEGDKMIVLRLHEWDRYADLGELRMAFDYLEQHKNADLAEGRHEIDEDHAFAIMIAPHSQVGR